MHSTLRIGLGVIAAAISAQAAAEIVFFEREGFRGESIRADQPVRNFERFDFNNRASSAVVMGSRWEVCEERRFEGRCAILRPGRYGSLNAMGLNDRISSARQIESNARVAQERYAQEPVPVYDNRRRQGERLYEANITAVRAVVGSPEQRCWVEREQVQAQGDFNVPGAVVGALIGGVLGHQVGSGSGNTAATIGGSVAGGAIGGNVGRSGQPQTRDVQKCASVPSQTPAYYDVSYEFRGQEHHMQMTTPPAGRTVTVNSRGEPRAG